MHFFHTGARLFAPFDGHGVLARRGPVAWTVGRYAEATLRVRVRNRLGGPRRLLAERMENHERTTNRAAFVKNLSAYRMQPDAVPGRTRGCQCGEERQQEKSG